MINRGRNRFVNELHTQKSGYSNTISNFVAEQAIAKEDEPCSTEMKQSGNEETRAESVRTPRQKYFTKVYIPLMKRKWKSIPVYPFFKGRTLSTAISKMVMRLVRRRHDQDERETDEAVHWNSIHPKLLRAFGSRGARKFSEKD